MDPDYLKAMPWPVNLAWIIDLLQPQRFEPAVIETKMESGHTRRRARGPVLFGFTAEVVLDQNAWLEIGSLVRHHHIKRFEISVNSEPKTVTLLWPPRSILKETIVVGVSHDRHIMIEFVAGPGSATP